MIKFESDTRLRLMKGLASPVLLFVVSFLPFILRAALSWAIPDWVQLVCMLIFVWHWTYLALFIGDPTRLRRAMTIAAFGLSGAIALIGALAPEGLFPAYIGDGIAIVCLPTLVLMAGLALSRALTANSFWSKVACTILTVYAPLTSFFYFKSAHTSDGKPRGAQNSPSGVMTDTLAASAAKTRAFWIRFQDATGETGQPRGVDRFGDSPEMNDELLALVLSRTKQATATLARWFENDPEGLPKPGTLWLIVDGRGEPACVIRTTQVDVMPVREVDAQFAWDEGEGDRSYDYWITEHRKYWQREAEREGFEYSDDLDVVCERFELVWAPEQA